MNFRTQSLIFPLIIFLTIWLQSSCNKPLPQEKGIIKSNNTLTNTEKDTQNRYELFFGNNPKYGINGFNFPVGEPDGEGYYNAQPFMKNTHLGDDWNAITGGNSDLGQPIFSIGNGIVSEVNDYKGGWGKVVRIVHQMPNGELRESLYAHCQDIFIKQGDGIIKGQKIATIGNVDGLYYAHLHLEIRWKIDAPLGSGYSTDTSGYLNPTEFIRQFRKVK